MATTALGIAPDESGSGVTPLTHRQILKAHWANTGVITGLAVSGRSDLTYAVAAGVAVCSRGSADGYTEAYWAGGTTPAVAAGAANPRIDCIWIRADDPTQGDADNHVTVGVTQGTPSATPVAPTVPAGCLKIMERLMPANATSTGASTANGTTSYAIPYGASTGRIGYAKVTSDYTLTEDKDKNGKMVYHEMVRCDFSVPTKRLVRIEWKARSTVGASTGSDKNERMGSYFLQLRMDGNAINDFPSPNASLISGPLDEIESTRYCESRYITYDVEVGPGSHRVSAWVCGNPSYLTYPVQFKAQRQITVTDIGVA